MSQWKALVALGITLLWAGFLPNAKADEWGKTTVVTFNQPVEIPGQTLPAGTYVLRLLDSPSNRNIVQIYNQDQTHLYATVMGIPTYRFTPSGKTVLKFEERAAGSPQALHDWFYPGDNYGNQFTYQPAPPATLTQTAQVTVTQPPPPQQAPPPPPQEQPAPQPQPQAEAQPAPQPEPQTQAMNQQPPPQPEQQQQQPEPAPSMPRTASDVPLVAALGLAFLAAAYVLSLLRKRDV